MTANVQQPLGLPAILMERFKQASQKVAALAQVIPADEFDARPVTGIRSVSEVFRHVGFWNQYVADTLSGKHADDRGNELPLGAYSTKASIVEALRRTSAELAAGLRQHREPIDRKITGLILGFSEHLAEHYGQLVVYARLIGIVPPASRT